MPKSVSPAYALLALIGYICAEIAAFIYIGGIIGIFASLFLVLLSAALGLALLRSDINSLPQALSGFFRQNGAQAQSGRKQAAGKAVLSRFLRAVAALLLIIPGFVSSLAGLCLLLPPVQSALTRLLLRRGGAEAVFTFRSSGGQETKAEIIDLTPEAGRPSDPENSPWRQNKQPPR